MSIPAAVQYFPGHNLAFQGTLTIPVTVVLEKQSLFKLKVIIKNNK